MPSIAEIEQQIVDLLPAPGQVMPYADFVNALNQAGLGQHAARLHTMRKRGMLVMSVVLTPDGIEHTVARPGGE